MGAPGPDGRVTYEESDAFDEEVSVTGTGLLPEPSPFGGVRHPDPCSLTIFGVTGDLSHRKLMPALYDLACHGVLPRQTTIVGYGRQAMDDDQFRALLRQAVDDHYGSDTVDGPICDQVLESPRYVQGQFEDPAGYRRLGAMLDELDRTNGTRGNRLYYLATPPSLFAPIIRHLGDAGLSRYGACDGDHALGAPVPGWTRIVIEKPFGHDLVSARELNRIIEGEFDERQVYRIDHYLAKETVQNLLVLSLRQRHLRADVEPALRRPRADHRGRDARRGASRAPTTRRPARCAT